MAETVNARIPPRVEQKLAEYCVKQGVTRTEAIIRALDHYLDQTAGGPDAYSLVADLIPEKGVRGVQAERARDLARKAFRAKRAR
jgi:plasmid stabilization system protein ParE